MVAGKWYVTYLLDLFGLFMEKTAQVCRSRRAIVRVRWDQGGKNIGPMAFLGSRKVLELKEGFEKMLITSVAHFVYM